MPDLPPPIVKSDLILPDAAGKGNLPLATGGGLAGNGYYRYVDSDEIGNPEAPVSNFRDIRTLGTPVAGISDDECVSVDLAAGATPPFEFTYFDVKYTLGVRVRQRADQLRRGGQPVLERVSPDWRRAGGRRDLRPDDWRVATNGRIPIYTFGTVPNRIFVAQWEQVSHFGEPAETNTFQIQLFERSGDIRVEYQNVDSGQPDALALYSIAGRPLPGRQRDGRQAHALPVDRARSTACTCAAARPAWTARPA
ncbi:MAG: hypothetical protein U0470_03135 [Anaerolineae bacterium]